MKDLIRALNELQLTFERIKISYKLRPPTIQFEAEMIIVKDNTICTIHYTQTALDNIRRIISQIRNQIIH